MKQHGYHFFVEEYGRLMHVLIRDQVCCIDEHTLAFLPGFLTLMRTGLTEYRTRIMTIQSKLGLTSKHL